MEKSVFCLTGGQVEYVFVVCGDTSFIVHTLGMQPVLASPSALKKKKKNQSWDKLTDILVSVIHCLSHDWTNGCHIFLGARSVYHLWFRMESQVEWAPLLSLKKLLAVLWHMDNPTRNQSLHSYRGNRWANMFPGGCPYYSGATGPPGDSGARWNWGVVTTEWTGNELLQDKWAATWEMRNLPTNSRGSGWMAASTLLPQLHSSYIYIYIYMPFSFLNWAGISECRRCWMAGRMNESGKRPLRWRQRHKTNICQPALALETQPEPTNVVLTQLFSESHEMTWYTILNLSNYRVRPPFSLLFLAPVLETSWFVMTLE